MNVTFLCNPSSFHINTWKKIYAHADFNAINYKSINRLPESLGPILGLFFNYLKLVEYILLGLRLKSLPGNWFLHAHGASGYGFAAFVSGKRYIATIYGSEILRNHSFVYDILMKLILSSASAVTVTSSEAEKVLISKFKVSQRKIHNFHTGIDTNYIDNVIQFIADKERSEDNPAICKVLSVRNCAPHYRIKDILSSCVKLVEAGHSLEVIVPLGNGSLDYLEEIKKSYNQNWIKYIPRRLENSQMLQLISESDVCISYASTDQLSSSILECLYLDKKIVLSNLPAYNELCKSQKVSQNLFFSEGIGDLSRKISEAMLSKSYRVSLEISDAYSVLAAANTFKNVLNNIK